MQINRVAIICDDTTRSGAIGFYCRRALSQLVHVEQFLPADVRRIPREFDLYLVVDDGLDHEIPGDLRPLAWWVIDLHLAFKRFLNVARHADFVFAAQHDGTALLQSSGVRHAKWLPLACDPEIHGCRPTAKLRDVAFVGRAGPGPRGEISRQIQKHFPSSFVGECNCQQISQVYAGARVAVNRSALNDINAQVFEALASGTLLLTNNLDENGLSSLFQNGRHLVTYRHWHDLLGRLEFFLDREQSRLRIAAAGRYEVLSKHTYRHRMQVILNAAADGLSMSNRRLIDQVDFGIKTFLRPRALLNLLNSILEFYPQANVVIADDGGLQHAQDSESRACRDLIASQPQFTLHSLPFASGVSAGRNLLIERTERPYLLFLDDDFCFTTETVVEKMLMRLLDDPRLGVVAGTCVDIVDGTRKVRNSGGTLNIVDGALKHSTSSWRDAVQRVCDYFPLFALIRREVFQNVRWAGGIGGEHYDFCLQVQRSGWLTGREEAVRIDHYPDTATLPGYIDYRYNYSGAQQQLLRKWNLRRIVQDGVVVCELDAGFGGESFSYGVSQGQAVADAIERLRAISPWPRTQPAIEIPVRHRGWFADGIQEMLERELTPHTQLVVELGSWLGMSTRFLAERIPHGQVIAIDHWQGSPEHLRNPEWQAMLPTLFETFQAMCWGYRDRIVPLRMTIQAGLRKVAECGLHPDLIFFDAEHSTEAVLADLELCRELFPSAVLVGDDYDDASVAAAVQCFAERYGFEILTTGSDWQSWKLLATPQSEELRRRQSRNEIGLTIISIADKANLGSARENALI